MPSTPFDFSGLLNDLAAQVANEVVERLANYSGSSKFEDEPQDGVTTAQWLKVDPQTLDRLRKAGKVPYVQVGRRVLYRPAAVLDALSTKQKGGAA